MKNKGWFQKGTHWRDEKPFWNKEWCIEQYIKLERSAADIAQEFSVTESAVLFWLRKHKIERRNISQARSIKHWGASGADNPMWNKRGELNPRWLGGVTPDRQAFYTSREWKNACSKVWKRDKASCQRCGLFHDDNPDMPMHVHHIVSFSNKELRADPSNLILLCKVCHLFVHSKRNVNNDYISKI